MRPTRRKVLIGLAATGPLLVTGIAPAAETPAVFVFKDPNCGCCGGWVEHLRAAGFEVTVSDSAAVNQVKARLGVPAELTSCHTAQVDGYVIEGHVPASALKKLLRDRPQAVGLAVPGMPIGSPGMEAGSHTPDTYDVVLFGPGVQRTFARFRGGQEIGR